MDLKQLKGLREKYLEGDKNSQWADPNWHLKNRVTTLEDLLASFPDISIPKQIFQSGYKLSIMPLSLLLALEYPELRGKNIPRLDFFEKNEVKKDDPYGIFSKGRRIEVDNVYLGSQKFPRSFLMNITTECPMGCVSCYKGEYTRTIDSEYLTDLSRAVGMQAEKLVEYLNKNSKIASVIVSGGEPLLLGNSGIEKMLNHFKKAEYLQELRFCTGSLFQGWPFRIDDELLNLLKGFEEEKEIPVHFNANLSHPAQFSTEAVEAVKKIRNYGFSINAQVPLQEGINVFRNDYEKMMGTLHQLAELQGKHGVRPYKYILHMNSGSLDYSVPLEFMLGVLGGLKYRTDHPLPETWQPVSMSILCREGNILLSPQLVFGMKKEVFSDFVEYQIPVPEEGGFRYVAYREPVMPGFNDDVKSLEKIKIIET